MAANGLLNLFQLSAPKPSAPPAPSALTQSADASPASRESGRKFARMVDDASPRDTNARDAANARVAVSSARIAASRRDHLSGSTPTALELNREITPEDATALLENFDALSANLSDLANNPQAEQQLKDQLAEIVISNEPKTLGDLLASVDEMPVDTLTSGSAEVTATVTAAATIGQTAQNVFHAIRKALSQSSEESPSQDINAEPSPIAAINPALLALQAATFQAAPQQAGDEKTATSTTEETVTVITPLAQSAVASYTTMQRAEVDHVDEADLPAAQDINARIPSLTLAKNDNALPEVELPKTYATAATNLDKKPTLATSDFIRQIETLGVTAQALVDGRNVKKDEPLAVAEVKAAQPVSAANAFTLGTGTTSHVGAPAPIAASSDVLGRGVVNHAPVREQVSIAIRQAVGNGSDEITLQLDPIELGRIQIKLHMNKEGHTQLAFLVDRPETFDALSRDARFLEQSLQDAGLKADTSGMQFNLRQQPQPQQMQSNAGGNGQPGNGEQHGATERDIGTVSAKPDIHASAAPIKNYRLDIRDGVDIEA